MKRRLRHSIVVTTAVIVADLAMVVWVPSVHAYSTWSGCKPCHGDFSSDTYISLADGTQWNTDLMSGHLGFLGSGTCNVCHQNTDQTPVKIALSDGIAGYSPISCLGCHGRAADAAGADACSAGNPAFIDPANCGMGAGLRSHHATAGIDVCADCHGTPSPVGENVAPPYYFTPDAAHPDKPIDSCNAAPPPGNENKFGPTGLDNDGDGLYDQEDPDCPAAGVCGNNVVDAGEDCDDGNTTFVFGEFCGPDCLRVPCGKPTNSTGDLPKASDALFTLRSAVGLFSCDLRVCDGDNSGVVTASDALRILRVAVGQPVTLDCPTTLEPALDVEMMSTSTTVPRLRAAH